MWQILELGIPVLEVLLTNRPNKIADVVENPVRVLRCSRRQSDHMDAFPGKYITKFVREFRSAIEDQIPLTAKEVIVHVGDIARDLFDNPVRSGLGVAGSNPVTPSNYARVLLTMMSCNLLVSNAKACAHRGS
jgi:hypothetical protein